MAKKHDHDHHDDDDGIWKPTDDQVEVMVRHQAEGFRLQIKHQTERSILMAKQAREREKAGIKIPAGSANGAMLQVPSR